MATKQTELDVQQWQDIARRISGQIKDGASLRQAVEETLRAGPMTTAQWTEFVHFFFVLADGDRALRGDVMRLLDAADTDLKAICRTLHDWRMAHSSEATDD